MDWIFYIIIIALAALYFYTKFIEPKQNNKTGSMPAESSQDGEDTKSKRKSYAGCYQSKFLLTKNEWFAHKKLMDLSKQHGLIICPKVRLLDIIEPRKGEKDYKTLFYKVQAKHVDFLVCDPGMKILGIIELDDSSHDQKERQSRDNFVNEILESVGYKVVHTRYINDNILDPFISSPAEE